MQVKINWLRRWYYGKLILRGTSGLTNEWQQLPEGEKNAPVFKRFSDEL